MAKFTKIEHRKRETMKKRTTELNLYMGTMEDDSLELLVDQEENCPDCSNAPTCCLFLSGQCNGSPKNCPDFDW